MGSTIKQSLTVPFWNMLPMSNKDGKMKNQLENKGEVVIYKTESGQDAIDVHLENETVWLNPGANGGVIWQRFAWQLRSNIGNIFKEKELQKKSVCKDFLHTAADRKKHIKHNIYNLDVIISVGYRVNSKRGTQFRIWGYKCSPGPSC